MTTSIAETAETTVLPTAETVKPANVKEVLAYLVKQYPLCFAADENVKPLKVGIFQDLAQRLDENSQLSKTQLRQALRVYTSSWRYLDATKEGANRVDLDGQPAEVIDAQQAEHAAKLLAESKQKAAEKRKVRMQEQRAKQQEAKTPVTPVEKKRPNKTFVKGSKPERATPKPVPVAAKKDVTSVQQSLTTLEPSQLAVGNKVLVKLGLTPMPATIQEVNLPDVTVQLGSGMVIKTRQDSLYQA
ncbi:RNA chaperone ProQ [Alishewanella longhuensis]|uniref:RNA chaperone ProQ n=1 Tax=Alishewanella longhuensis TaxID=1091037 RepID=A0ABQ3L253_9ALTE|nr:RNA chaperone ProQ [Alishewanella longhuensis]GHG77119.1 RNA chaperone ProQ [Alishewanella longhuensis]